MIKEIGETTDPTCMFALSTQHYQQDTKIDAGGMAHFSLWAVTESFVVIIGASVPTLGAFFRKRKSLTPCQHNYGLEDCEYTSTKAAVESSGTRASASWTRIDDGAPDPGRHCTTIRGTGGWPCRQER
jgi:hypothetical protein